MRIALIDNGVDARLVDVSTQIDFTNQDDVEIHGDVEKYNHGTVCAAIIKKYAAQADIISLKVMGSQAKSCCIGHVINAVKYCMSHDIQLVSMSIGTRSIIDAAIMHDCITDAINNNMIIVAPGCRKLRVYPAAYDGVVYVDINDDIFSGDAQYYKEIPENGMLSLIASGKQEILMNNKDLFVTRNYASFAAPVITAQLWNILQSGCTEPISYLYQNAKDITAM